MQAEEVARERLVASEPPSQRLQSSEQGWFFFKWNHCPLQRGRLWGCAVELLGSGGRSASPGLREDHLPSLYRLYPLKSVRGFSERSPRSLGVWEDHSFCQPKCKNAFRADSSHQTPGWSMASWEGV